MVCYRGPRAVPTMVLLLGLAAIGQLARPSSALSYDDLTDEQKAEVREDGETG